MSSWSPERFLHTGLGRLLVFKRKEQNRETSARQGNLVSAREPYHFLYGRREPQLQAQEGVNSALQREFDNPPVSFDCRLYLGQLLVVSANRLDDHGFVEINSGK